MATRASRAAPTGAFDDFDIVLPFALLEGCTGRTMVSRATCEQITIDLRQSQKLLDLLSLLLFIWKIVRRNLALRKRTFACG